ncbi:MAG: sigma-70 family RNA polymerase sigma factor [Nitrospirae bacterium]|nr:MAG: sigma-70 family RNA polymerase sigma factor [Nitrospirota bacterium]
MDSSARPASALSPDLLAQVAKGSQQAFEELYDQSSALLYTLAVRILGDRDEATELLQEIYLEVWRKVARYDVGRGSPMAWLVTLARSRAIDRLRSRASKGYGTTDPIDEQLAAQLSNHDPSPLEDRQQTELRTSVRKALAELPEGQQQALELAYFEGLSHTEIAERLRQPVGTIKTRIKLGMTKLKISLQPWID